MIKQTGYDTRTDLWSLGCIVYEMLCGKVPFGEDLESPHEVYNAIENEKWDWPQALAKNTQAYAFIDKLLNRNPAKRGTAHSLKDDNWFTNVNYGEYQMQNVEAPHFPELDPLPTSAIEGTFEQILLSNESKFDTNKRMPILHAVPNFDADF